MGQTWRVWPALSLELRAHAQLEGPPVHMSHPPKSISKSRLVTKERSRTRCVHCSEDECVACSDGSKPNNQQEREPNPIQNGAKWKNNTRNASFPLLIEYAYFARAAVTSVFPRFVGWQTPFFAFGNEGCQKNDWYPRQFGLKTLCSGTFRFVFLLVRLRN
eukprot:4431598-Amphidinium_carterae.1